MHAVDMQWLVMPMAAHGGQHSHFGVTLAEVLCFIGVGEPSLVRGPSLWAESIVPIKDPYLKESMSYEVALS